MALKDDLNEWAAENNSKLAERLNKVLLEKFRIGSRSILPLGLFNDIEVNVICDIASDQMVAQLVGYLTAHRAENFAYPADWWQAFKERWFPKWLLRKYPIQYKTLDVFAVYPIVIPKLSEHMVLMFQMKGERDDGSGDGDPVSDSGLRGA